MAIRHLGEARGTWASPIGAIVSVADAAQTITDTRFALASRMLYQSGLSTRSSAG
jgi:hypothetical protein